MNRDTELTEVARFLPRVAAEFLVDRPPVLQRVVLENVRQSVCEWEERGVHLDPVQFDVVVTTLVRDLVSAHSETLEVLIQRQAEDPWQPLT